MVSFITSKEIEFWSNSVTVKQHPLTAMLAPINNPSENPSFTATSKVKPDSFFSNAFTLPSSWTIPVNIIQSNSFL